ncbi:hypothetical protein [Arthrobacter sp. NPDC056493]|uniref:hypothetical protein n=1 Tax=Arthrobacter sp. NPDC056493 TaxID=3345839 RepID=UPI00366F7C1D
MNERIALTSFKDQAAPAVARWKERETEVLASVPHPGFTLRNPQLLYRHRPAVPLVQPHAPVAPRPLTRRVPGYREPVTIWRLISGNHRELGRGAGTFASEALAVSHAQSALDHASTLKVSFIRHPDTGTYGWHAGSGSRPLIMAPAWYGTARDCEKSAASALRALMDATISAAVAKHGPRYATESPGDAVPALQPC